MVTRDIFGLGAAVIVLAGLSMAIVHGKDTATMLNGAGSAFSNVIKAATLRG